VFVEIVPSAVVSAISCTVNIPFTVTAALATTFPFTVKSLKVTFEFVATA